MGQRERLYRRHHGWGELGGGVTAGQEAEVPRGCDGAEPVAIVIEWRGLLGFEGGQRGASGRERGRTEGQGPAVLATVGDASHVPCRPYMTMRALIRGGAVARMAGQGERLGIEKGREEGRGSLDPRVADLQAVLGGVQRRGGPGESGMHGRRPPIYGVFPARSSPPHSS